MNNGMSSKRIKCVIWDLDDTLWKGALTEGGAGELCDGVLDTLKILDKRGILQSIASKNDYDVAMKRLKSFGIDELFLCPEISWGAKSEGVTRIIERLNLKEFNIAFIDDSCIQRDEVAFVHPEVTLYDASQASHLPDYPEMQVKFITEDSANRRKMYMADIRRDDSKKSFPGSDEAFLKTLNMKLCISRVDNSQLKRVEELTVRTHQLNSTGYTYSYEELEGLIGLDSHAFFIAGLTDVYGDSGKVGIVLLEDSGEAYVIKLLIVSCRVMTRGIGGALLAHAVRFAMNAGKKLWAEYLETEYNRIMYITYKLAGFEEVGTTPDGKGIILEYARDSIPDYPDYLCVTDDV